MTRSRWLAAAVVIGAARAVLIKAVFFKPPPPESTSRPALVVDGVPVSQKALETFVATEKRVDGGPVLVIEERGKVELDDTTIIVGSPEKKALVHGVLAAVYPKLMGEPVNGMLDFSIGSSHPRVYTADEYAAMVGGDPPKITVERLLKLPKAVRERVPGFTWFDGVPIPHSTPEAAKAEALRGLGARYAVVYRSLNVGGAPLGEGGPMRPESAAEARAPFDIGPVRVVESRVAGGVDSCKLVVASAQDQELARALLHAAFPRLIDPSGRGKYLRGVFRLDELAGGRAALQGQLAGRFAVAERTLGDRRPR